MGGQRRAPEGGCASVKAVGDLHLSRHGVLGSAPDEGCVVLALVELGDQSERPEHVVAEASALSCSKLQLVSSTTSWNTPTICATLGEQASMTRRGRCWQPWSLSGLRPKGWA
jgi:hypothetical protein